MEKELNKLQKQIAGLLILSFRTRHCTKATKIKSDEIMLQLGLRGYSIDDSQLREIIGHIRRNDLCQPGFILSDNTGYWYSEDEAEMQPVWEAQHSRALNIMKNFAPLHKRFKHLLSQQNSLFG